MHREWAGHEKEGQGLVRKALQSNDYFVSCVKELDHPIHGFKPALAIGLKSKCFNNDYYVIEFFLHSRWKVEESIRKEILKALYENSKDWRFVSLLESIGADNSKQVFKRPIDVKTCCTYQQDTTKVGKDGGPQEKSSRKRKNSSEVWKGFDKVKEDGKLWATCKVCEKKLRGESSRGTSNLHTHFNKCFKKNQGDGQHNDLMTVGAGNKGGAPSIDPPALHVQNQGNVQRSDLMTIVAGNQGDSHSMDPPNDSRTISAAELSSVFDQERSSVDLAKMILKHGYLLNMPQHEFFQVFVKNLQPLFNINSLDYIKANVLHIYKSEKERLTKYLCSISSHFTLTVDLQSHGDRGIVYCCLRLSFIDEEWKLRQKIIGFKDLGYVVPPDQTLSEVIGSMVSEWNINDKVLLVVANEVPHANYFLAGELGSISQSDQCSILKRDTLLAPSYTQFLNLLADYALNEIGGFLKKFQESINILNFQDKKMDTEDVSKRWVTEFLMLGNALKLENVFCHLEQTDSDVIKNPSAEEWNKARVIYECLKPLHEFISLPSPRLDMFIQNVRSFHKNLIKWQHSEFAYVHSLVNKMKEKFEEYWSTHCFVFQMMAVLDPRFKFVPVDYAYKKMFKTNAEEKLHAIRADLAGLYKKYANTSYHEVLATSNSDDDDIDDFHEWKRKYYSDGELDRYLKLQTESPEVDVLSWWHDNSSKFPVVGRMARDFLALDPMPCIRTSAYITEVMKNPCFSDLERNDPIVEALICGQDLLEFPKTKIIQEDGLLITRVGS